MRVTGVSFSSDKKLARCEMQFSYRYDQKLKPRVKKVGLYRGDWIHQLLEAHYRGTGWEKKFAELRKTQWDKLFVEEREEYGEHFPEEIHALVAHYVDHWRDDWEIVHVEKPFELMTRFGFPIRWKADLIVRDEGILKLVENKNKKKIPESDERILSPQVHAYCYLLSKVGIPVKSIVWNYIRTEPVPSPQILKDGSLSKRKINTDQRTYLAALAGAKPDAETKKLISHLPETLSLLRVTNTPNLRIGGQFVRDWVERALRAQKIKRPLRSWDRTCSWMCDYYDLCQVDMLGKDRSVIIKKDFVQIGDSYAAS